MTNQEFLSRLSPVLESGKIKNLKQLTQECDPVLTTTISYHDTQRENWIVELYNLVREYFQGFASNDSRPLHFVSPQLDTNTLKYMCIFPSSLILTEPFFTTSYYAGAATDYKINRSYLEMVMKYSEYIKQDIISLLPRSFDLAMSYSAGWSVTTLSGNDTFRTQEYWDRDPTALLDVNGIALTKERIEELFFQFPFLYGARAEDYLNITTKYGDQYCKYRILIQKFVEALDRGEKTIRDLYLDMQDAHVQMQIHLETERENLFKKGICTVLGLAITCIPFAVDIPDELRVFIQSLLGTASLKELSSSIFETEKNIRVLHQNPYFVTWRWKRKSPQDQKGKTMMI